MILELIARALKNRLLVLLGVLGILGIGIAAFKALPIEAYPDVADPWVQVITQWPGHAAEEVERQLTVPIEVGLCALPQRTSLRSVSLFQLSVVTVLFEEGTSSFEARKNVLEELQNVNFPPGVTPSLAPDESPAGQIYWYIMQGKDYSAMDLKDFQDWTVYKHMCEVPNLVDDSAMGGLTKQYQILLNPLSMANYGLNEGAVAQAVAANNQNTGGGFITQGEQVFDVRGIGYTDTLGALGNIVVAEHNGTPVFVRNLGDVQIGSRTRLGKVSYAERLKDGTVSRQDDVVEGIVAARVGSNYQQVLDRLHDKVKEINEKFLPSGAWIKPVLDRSDLLGLTTRTVGENLGTGMLLVVLVLLFFLGNIRSALIVASTIPFSLLFASILLDLRHIPANLLSIGALDFGMVVDGAVVLVENVYRHKEFEKERPRKKGAHAKDMLQVIVEAAQEVQRPMVFAVAIIILAYLPIFTLQRVEGRIFAPMAWTVSFALLGSLVFVMSAVPVLCYYFMQGDLKEWHNPVLAWLERNYMKALHWALERKPLILGIGILCLLFSLILAFGGPIGSEFLPHMDEGALWCRGTLPTSANYESANQVTLKARDIFMRYPEVPQCLCTLGRPDDGTDDGGFYNTEYFVDLLPRKRWRSQFKTKEELIDAMSKDLNTELPGVIWNFSQPIEDNVEEALSGVKGELVTKLYGPDLYVLDRKAKEIKAVMASVRGISDLGVFEELGQPNLNIVVDREKIARYGLNVSDVQNTIQTAVGGNVASQWVEGEKSFDILVRFQPQFRDSIDAIKHITVSTPDGYRVPLDALCSFKVEDGASVIYRDAGSRYVAIKYSVRDRDLGGAVSEAQAKVAKNVVLAPGYWVNWEGEFESERRASARLAIIVPLTILAIFIVLYLVFDSFKWALVVLSSVAMAPVGGILALFLTRTNFSVSSGVGFLALFGVSVQVGVLLISYIHQMRAKGMALTEAVFEGARLRLRPIMMTALVATFGLVPAALSHAIGSDSQRPMAIVIVGGLMTDLVMGFFLLPVFYVWAAHKDDHLKF